MFRNPIVRDVTLVVVLKTAAILAAGFFLFGPAERPHVTARSVEAKLFGSPPASFSSDPTPKQ